MRCVLLLICTGMASAIGVTDVALVLNRSLIAIAVLLFLLLIIARLKVTDLVRRLAIGLLAALVGFCWHLAWARQHLEERLPEILEGRTLEVEGVVVGLPERSSIAQQFQFQILRSPSGFFPRKVILNYYGDATVLPGQNWRFAVRLNRPHGFANPGGFDYEGWLFQQGVNARGYVRDSASNELLTAFNAEDYRLSAIWIHRLRYTLRSRLEGLGGDAQYLGLLIALVLGDRAAIAQSDWALFSATGSNHLFVISGLHIGLISGFCYLLALQAGHVTRIGSLVPAQKFAAFIALNAALFYALLAGFTLPTQRAFIMTAVLICGLFWNTRYLISFRLLLALTVVLALNPLAIIGSGFWLSFVAVAALLAFAGESLPTRAVDLAESSLFERLRTGFIHVLRPQIIVLLSLALPLVFFTGQFSLLSPLVNVVAIPVVGFLIVPLCFTALVLSYVHDATATVVLQAAHGCISLLMKLIEALANWGAAVFQLEFPQLGALPFISLFFAVMLLLLPRSVCRRILIVPLLLPLVPFSKSIDPASAAESSLRVHIIDVGQGLAVVVQTSKHALLFDSGAQLSPDFNLGSAVVIPALRALGVTRLDAVVISHGDNDHAGGLSGIRQHMEIDTLIGNGERLDAGMDVVLCHSLQEWNWDGVTFRFLHTGVDFDDANNNSCVLQVRDGSAAVLLPGDIEREAEARLVVCYGDELASTVLLAPHHGSLSSSSYALIKKVRPDYVVFSSGYYNSFGHPHERVMARYGEFDSLALTTSQTGMISFDFDRKISGIGDARQPDLYREQNTRYWR